MHLGRLIGVLLALGVSVWSGPARAQKLKLSASVKDLETAARRDSNDAAAQYNLALGYWSQKRWDEVESHLRLATRIEYRFADAHLARSFLIVARLPRLVDEAKHSGDTTALVAARAERERLYRLAVLLDPFVDHKLAGAIPRPRLAPSERFAALLISLFLFIGAPEGFYQALDDLAEGKPEEAFQRLTRIKEEYRNKPQDLPRDVLWYQALAGVRSGHDADALADLQSLLDRAELTARDSLVDDPLQANDYRYALARLHQKLGHLPEADALYREVVVRDLGMYLAHVRLAEMHESRQDWNAALRERRTALDLNQEDHTLVLEIGITLGRAGRLPEADSVLRAAAAAAPRDSRVVYYQGLVAQARQAPAEARSYYERFLALAPSRYATQIADARRRLDALP
jgi:Tfp pilus assembly protein PilF